MRYLVTMEYVEPGPQMPPQEIVQIVERLVLPTFQACMKLEAEKRILGGGIVSGERAAAMIVEASSHEELTEMLEGLPIWGVMKVQVKPLDTFQHRHEIDSRFLQHFRSMHQGQR